MLTGITGTWFVYWIERRFIAYYHSNEAPHCTQSTSLSAQCSAFHTSSNKAPVKASVTKPHHICIPLHCRLQVFQFLLATDRLQKPWIKSASSVNYTEPRTKLISIFGHPGSPTKAITNGASQHGKSAHRLQALKLRLRSHRIYLKTSPRQKILMCCYD